MKKNEFSDAELKEIAARVTAATPSDMTQTELAKRLGISQPSLSDLLSGKAKQFKAITAVRLAKTLKLSTDYLLLISNSATASSPNQFSLNALEVDLIQMYRKLPTSSQESLTQIANNLLSAMETRPSIVDPYQGTKVRLREHTEPVDIQPKRKPRL